MTSVSRLVGAAVLFATAAGGTLRGVASSDVASSGVIPDAGERRLEEFRIPFLPPDDNWNLIDGLRSRCDKVASASKCAGGYPANGEWHEGTAQFSKINYLVKTIFSHSPSQSDGLNVLKQTLDNAGFLNKMVPVLVEEGKAYSQSLSEKTGLSIDQIRKKISGMRVSVTSWKDENLELNSIALKQLLILCLYADPSMADIKKIIPEIEDVSTANDDNDLSSLSSKRKMEVMSTLRLLDVAGKIVYFNESGIPKRVGNGDALTFGIQSGNSDLIEALLEQGHKFTREHLDAFFSAQNFHIGIFEQFMEQTGVSNEDIMSAIDAHANELTGGLFSIRMYMQFKEMQEKQDNLRLVVFSIGAGVCFSVLSSVFYNLRQNQERLQTQLEQMHNKMNEMQNKIRETLGGASRGDEGRELRAFLIGRSEDEPEPSL